MALFDAVFGGGGAKGVAFAGALEVLIGRGHRLRRYIGTSAGAITATLAAVGYTPAEMLAAVSERTAEGKPRFTEFMDIPAADGFSRELRNRSVIMEAFGEIDVPLVSAALEQRFDEMMLDRLLHTRIFARLFSFVECGGFYAGNAFLDWLREKLRAKGIADGATLGELDGIDLSLVVSDTTDMEMLVLNRRTAPKVPVAWAVRMSMSIPFVWQEVIWRPEWGQYLGRQKTGNSIVDGGCLSNFPIRMIAESGASIQEVMGDTDPDGAKNLGLMIDEEIAVPGAPDSRKTPIGFTRLRTIQRVSRLLDTLRGAADNEAIRRHKDEICRLPAKGYGTLEFDMEGERLELFLKAARDTMSKHLDARAL
jgi:predicted acylesterase/phospholipase RssA